MTCQRDANTADYYAAGHEAVFVGANTGLYLIQSPKLECQHTSM